MQIAKDVLAFTFGGLLAFTFLVAVFIPLIAALIILTT
jgi:hypothetical protein